MIRIHEMAQELDGCTHIRERRHESLIEDDGNGGVRVCVSIKVQGGRIVNGEFSPVRASGRPTSVEEETISFADWEDYAAFQAAFEADPTQPVRGLEHRVHVCRLAYLQAKQLGLWPPQDNG